MKIQASPTIPGTTIQRVQADREGWDRVQELARSLVIAMGVPEILK